jgi:zinc protease
VKNERRQRVDNQPYGLADETLGHMLYPAGHPYYWPVIGSMADLSAASVADVKEFFRKWYAPNDAAIVVAGDVQPDSVRAFVRRYFSAIPRGPAIDRRTTVPPVALRRDTVAVLEDHVQLPRLYYQWHTVKSYAPDDAALGLAAYILAGAKNSRLTQKLVYDLQLASDVVVYQYGKRLDGDFDLYATARPGRALPELQRVVDAELRRLADQGPTARELEQAKNSTEKDFLGQLETVRDKADALNNYYYFIGRPDGFQWDLDRYRAVTAADVQRVVRQYLLAPKAVLSIVPQGKTDLAVKTEGVKP